MRFTPTAVALAAISLLATAPAPAQFEIDSCLSASPDTITNGGTSGLSDVVAVDLDDDGNQDLITTSFGDDRVIWWKNDGGATFEERTLASNVRGAKDIAVGDLNGDGRLDIVVAAFETDSVAWIEQLEEDGEFVVRTIATGMDGAESVAVFDLDGDGFEDVLVAAVLGDRLYWLRQETESVDDDMDPMTPEIEVPFDPPTFERTALSARAPNAATATVLDLPGAADVVVAELDGEPGEEVVVASRLDNTIRWITNVGEEDELDLVVRTITDTALGVDSIDAADLDGDGDVDVAAAVPGDGRVTWYRNNGSGTFTTRVAASQLASPRFVRAANVVSTGGADLLVATDDFVNPSILLLDNDENPSPTFTRISLATDIVAPKALAAADLNGGGADVVSASSFTGPPSRDDMLVWFDGANAFMPTVISSAALLPEDILLTDLDGNGRVDVVVAAPLENRIRYFEADMDPEGCTPDFPETSNVLMGAMGELEAGGVVSIAAHDFDGGDRPDIVAALPSEGRIAWFENDGNGGFTKRSLTDNALGASYVGVADVDGDGMEDVIATATGEGKVMWFRWESTGFGEEAVLWSETGSGPVFVHAVPPDPGIDADGDEIDLLVALRDANRVLWLRNDGDENFEPIPISNSVSRPRAIETMEILDQVYFDVDPSADDRPSLVNRVEVVTAGSGNGTIAWHQYVEPVPNAEPAEVELGCSAGPLTVSIPPTLPDTVYRFTETERTFTVTNTTDGDEPLTVTLAIDNPNLAFSLSTTELTLDMMTESAPVTLTFSPSTIVDPDPVELTVSAPGVTSTVCGIEVSRSVGFMPVIISNLAFGARQLEAHDFDGDGDEDLLSVSSDDQTVSIFFRETEDVFEDPEPAAGPMVIGQTTSWFESALTTAAPGARAAFYGNLEDPAAPAKDVVTAYLFQVDAHCGDRVERCGDFDVDDDDVISGVELAWLAAAFALPGPLPTWALAVDYDGDGDVTGDDLAILTSSGVFGRLAERATSDLQCNPEVTDPESTLFCTGDALRRLCSYECIPRD